jgi:hypothetical protein
VAAKWAVDVINNQSLPNELKIGKIIIFQETFINDVQQWGAFYLFIANFFAAQIIGGAKDLVVLLLLSGNI